MASPRRSSGLPERQPSPVGNSDPASQSTSASTSHPQAPVEPWADPSAFASVASRNPSAPAPSSSERLPPAPTASEGAATSGADGPRIPWTGRIPAFFQLGPDGSLIPHFAVAPNDTAPTQPTAGNNTDNTADAQPTAPATGGAATNPRPAPSAMPHLHLPPLPTDGRFPPFFPFMLPISGLRNRRRDPEAAAELLRSLPTVDKGLFKRVERVIVAEQVQNEEDEDEQGWKCGICLEGRDPDAKETGIKALPCNHLFHGDCLEPWFATNHTCPTCRLDLDPLKTLRKNRGNNAGRPGATGSGRSTPHPYARPGAATPPVVGIDPGSGATDGLSFTVIWQMPLPMDALPPAAAPAGQAENPQSNTTEPGTAASAAETPDRPRTPTLRFTFPLSASPLPINREGSASPMSRSENPSTPTPAEIATTAAPAAPSTETSNPTANTTSAGDSLPRPQPRRHITVVHNHHPSQAAPGSPHHHHHILPHPGSPHHHHHHHLRPPGASTPAPAPSTLPSDVPPPTSDDVNAASGTANGGQSGGAASPDSRGPVTPTDQPGTNNGTSIRPHFHVFFNVYDQPLGDMPGVENAAQASESAEPPSQPERPSLSQWVTTRERSLGWRCDAPDCGMAPSEDDDEDIAMPAPEDKGMLPIFSSLQPPKTTGSPDTEKGFELHSCEHRWHRSCLESVERTAGRNLTQDAEGRVWVRCEACRKEGWIWPRTRSIDEGEVDLLAAGR